jgi:hypothetical protein
MAKNVAGIMLAVLILLLVTILPATVRQEQRIIIRFTKSSTVAIVDRHFVLSIAEVAIWTCPTVESQQFFRLLLRFRIALQIVKIFLFIVIFLRLIF